MAQFPAGSPAHAATGSKSAPVSVDHQSEVAGEDHEGKRLFCPAAANPPGAPG